MNKNNKIILTIVIVIVLLILVFLLVKTFTGYAIIESGIPSSNWCQNADASRDGRVTATDLSVIYAKNGRTNCSIANHWCLKADVDRDGFVNLSDVNYAWSKRTIGGCFGCYDTCNSYLQKTCSGNFSNSCQADFTNTCWELNSTYCPNGCNNTNGECITIIKPEIFENGSISVSGGAYGSIQSKIYLDGIYRGEIPMYIYNVTPGNHTVRLFLMNYQNNSIEINVSSGSMSSVNLSLAKFSGDYENGSIYVISNFPVSYSSVYVDDKYYGYLPLMITKLKPGIHKVGIYATGYKSLIKDVIVKTAETISIEANLIRTDEDDSKGVIDVNSDFNGAKIYFDGVIKGSTPLYIPANVGVHTLKVTSPGYKNWTGQVYVYSGSFPRTHVYANLNRVY